MNLATSQQREPLFSSRFRRGRRKGIPRFQSSGGSQITSNRWEEVQTKVRNALPDFLGRTLEDWFRRSAIEDGPWFDVGGWWDRKGENEIDLVAADSSEKRLLFGEVKLNPKKYNEVKLRMKATRFLEANPRFADWSQEFRGLSPEDMLRSL